MCDYRSMRMVTMEFLNIEILLRISSLFVVNKLWQNWEEECFLFDFARKCDRFGRKYSHILILIQPSWDNSSNSSSQLISVSILLPITVNKVHIHGTLIIVLSLLVFQSRISVWVYLVTNITAFQWRFIYLPLWANRKALTVWLETV